MLGTAIDSHESELLFHHAVRLLTWKYVPGRNAAFDCSMTVSPATSNPGPIRTCKFRDRTDAALEPNESGRFSMIPADTTALFAPPYSDFHACICPLAFCICRSNISIRTGVL